jgi:hypothetical protein
MEARLRRRPAQATRGAGRGQAGRRLSARCSAPGECRRCGRARAQRGPREQSGRRAQARGRDGPGAEAARVGADWRVALVAQGSWWRGLAGVLARACAGGLGAARERLSAAPAARRSQGGGSAQERGGRAK